MFPYLCLLSPLIMSYHRCPSLHCPSLFSYLWFTQVYTLIFLSCALWFTCSYSCSCALSSQSCSISTRLTPNSCSPQAPKTSYIWTHAHTTTCTHTHHEIHSVQLTLPCSGGMKFGHLPISTQTHEHILSRTHIYSDTQTQTLSVTLYLSH